MENFSKQKDFVNSPELLQQLLAHGTPKVLHTGEVIVPEGSLMRNIPMVLSGSLKVIRTEEDGREIFLYYIKPGESCIISFLGGLHEDRSKIKAEVEEDAEILFLPMEKAAVLFSENPQWVYYIFRQYRQKFEELLEAINELAFRKVDQRMLNLLKKKVELTGSNIIAITHEQLANELGTARVVVSRLLKHLEEQGQVRLQRGKITLL